MEADVDITLPRVRESVPRARRLVESVAMAIAPSPRVDDLVLAVSELCTNVVQHASGEEFRLHLEVCSGAAVARIDDEGTLHNTGPPDTSNGDRRAMPPSTSLRGRGLAIVEALVDQMRIDEHPRGEWTVTLQHDLYDSPVAASA